MSALRAGWFTPRTAPPTWVVLPSVAADPPVALAWDRWLAAEPEPAPTGAALPEAVEPVPIAASSLGALDIGELARALERSNAALVDAHQAFLEQSDAAARHLEALVERLQSALDPDSE